MTAPQIDMHCLQEAVRLHRLGTSQRSIAAKLKMGRDTLRSYLKALKVAHLLDSSPEHLVEMTALREASASGGQRSSGPHQSSSVAAWRQQIEERRSRGAGPKAIHDYL